MLLSKCNVQSFYKSKTNIKTLMHAFNNSVATMICDFDSADAFQNTISNVNVITFS